LGLRPEMQHISLFWYYCILYRYQYRTGYRYIPVIKKFYLKLSKKKLGIDEEIEMFIWFLNL
jgi:hypothetical protein